MIRSRVFRRSLTAFCLTGLLLATATSSLAAESATADDAASRWWFGAQAGLDVVLFRAESALFHAGRVHPRVDLEGGLNINRTWRVGLLLGAGARGNKICQGGDDLDCFATDLILYNQYLTMIANPGGGHWSFAVAAGRAALDLHPNPLPNRLDHDPSGVGLRLAVGRDWDFGESRRHLGWRANLDAVNTGKASGSGSSRTYHATVSLSASLSWY